jgi:hypothetical protein
LPSASIDLRFLWYSKISFWLQSQRDMPAFGTDRCSPFTVTTSWQRGATYRFADRNHGVYDATYTPTGITPKVTTSAAAWNRRRSPRRREGAGGGSWRSSDSRGSAAVLSGDGSARRGRSRTTSHAKATAATTGRSGAAAHFEEIASPNAIPEASRHHRGPVRPGERARSSSSSQTPRRMKNERKMSSIASRDCTNWSPSTPSRTAAAPASHRDSHRRRPIR